MPVVKGGQKLQYSRGHKGQICVDKKDVFSWTLLVNSSGHFFPQEFLFLGEFSWTFLGEFFSWTKVFTRSHCPRNVSISELK